MTEVRRVIPPPGPRWLRIAVAIAGSIYLASVFLGSAGCPAPADTLPRPVLYFTQVACLFPRAATRAIDYRLSGYSCADQRFQELDHRVYFPIHPDDKENRFHRVGHFYRRNRTVMNALEDHIVERHNQRVARGEVPGDGVDGAIGGILLESLRIPLPAPGTAVERYRRVPLAEIPNEWRKRWYYTPVSRRRDQCKELP
jgi:hypothetical protein